jgi:hypothetical protein
VDPPSAPDLTDSALAAEIELLGELVLAASRAPGRLTQDEVDQVLKLAPTTQCGCRSGATPPTPAADES